MSDRFGNIPIQTPESTSSKKKPARQTYRAPVVTPPKGKKLTPFKAWVWISSVLAIVVCYCSFGYLGVPYYITNIFPEKFLNKTGMVLEIATVTFNPFAFRLESGAIRVLSESGTSILTLNSLQADISPTALLRLNMVCNTLTIADIDLNIARELDGSYNFQQIFGDKKNHSPLELLNVSDLPFSFSLNNISLTNGNIKFNDIQAKKIHTIEQIQLKLPTFSNIPFQTAHYLRPHFSAIFNGSPIELTGQPHIGKIGKLGKSDGENLATKLSLDIHKLDLSNYTSYLPSQLPLAFTKGTVDGKIDLLFDPKNKSEDKLSIGFQLQISGAELSKKDESIIVDVPTALLKGNLLPVSKNLHFTEISLKKPTIRSFGKSLLANIRQKTQEDGLSFVPGSTQASPYHLTIDHLLADNGKVQFFSKKKNREPAATWIALQLSFKNYQSRLVKIGDKSGGSFNFSGEKDGSATNFSWQGTFSSMDKLAGKLTLEKIDANTLLQSFSPNHPFNLNGTADLNGRLMFYSRQDSASSYEYKLVDTEISIEDFALVEDKKRILTASLVKLSPLSIDNESINFGNIKFEKGRALFTYGQLPNFFTTFDSSKYRLQGIDYEGQASFDSQKKQGLQLTFDNISLKANSLDTLKETQNNLSISGKTDSGGIFQATGEVTMLPFSLSINTGFRALPINTVVPFFTASPLLSHLTGDLSGKGLLTLPAKSFAGELQLTNFSNKSSQKSAYSWQKSVFHNFNYTAQPFHLGISSAEIDQAIFSWEITHTDNDPVQYLTDFFKNFSPKDANRAPNKPKIAISPIDIQEISFSNSTVNILDRRLTPNWKAEVNDLSGSIKDIHATAATSKSAFSFSGKLDDSPLIVSGKTDFFSKKANGALRYSLENYPLASFHKQLSSKTEVDTSKGEFQLTLDCTWQNQHYISSGTLILADLEPVTTTSDVALPLALLTQPDGTVRHSFNFSRTAPVAKTALLDELFTSFQRKIIKGTVSPFLLANGDFSDLIGNEIVQFLPGEFMLSETGREVLARYATFLSSHPHVGLVLSGGVDQKIDRAAMKERLSNIEQQRVEKENTKLFRLWQEKKTQYEEKLIEQQRKAGPGGNFIEQDIPSDVLAGFIPIRPEPIDIDKAMLLELAQNRINILYQYFTTQLELQPGQLSSVTPDNFIDAPEKQSNGVTISLKAIN